MKVTLQLYDGREMTFSKVNNISIGEDYFKNNDVKKKVPEDMKKPKEGEWFKVNPLLINQGLFQAKRNDFWQERARLLILDAFKEAEKNAKYSKPFKTMVPKEDWPETTTIGRLKNLMFERGYQLADWVELALEWAQRIDNGELWEDICNRPDTSNCCRLIAWKDGTSRLAGSCESKKAYCHPQASLEDRIYYDYSSIGNVVPLIVIYD